MPAAASSRPSLIRTLDAAVVRAAVEAHGRYLKGLPKGRRAVLQYVNLNNYELDGVDLSEADLTGALLGGASLRGTRLARAVLYGADLRDADLRGADLSRSDMRGACLRGANLGDADLTGCDLREGVTAVLDDDKGLRILEHSSRPGELGYAMLEGASLAGAQMSGAFARQVDFTDADLSNVSLRGARLTNARMDGANLSGASLQNAEMANVSLRRAVMVGADLGGADLTDADLTQVLRAPPPIIYIDDEPLHEVLEAHELFCESNGREGKIGDLAEVDFRPLKRLKGRRLSGLSAPRAVFFGMDLEGA